MLWLPGIQLAGGMGETSEKDAKHLYPCMVDDP